MSSARTYKDEDTMFTTQRKLPLILLSLFLSACGDGSRTESIETRRAADNSVQAGMVGAIYGEIEDQTIRMSAAGVIEQGTSTPLHNDHYMALGSNGKSMTAMLAGAMVDAGLVRWETRILEVLPELQGKILNAYEQVTLEQLLSHRSGLLPLTSADEADSFDLTSVPDDPRERRMTAVQWILEQPPQAVPGVEFLYSNAGYTVAGAMLEKLGNDEYFRLLNSWVLEPLGLHLIPGMPATTLVGQPKGHSGNPNTLITVDPQDELLLLIDDLLEPSGNDSMKASDYARYLQWHLVALKGQPTPIPSAYIEILLSASEGDYALGWVAVTFENRIVLTHMGNVDGFTTTAIMDRSGDKAVIGLTNTEAGEGEGEDDWVAVGLQTEALRLFSD
jgi:CubicO group peptidase (beta-lactamase class C family)